MVTCRIDRLGIQVGCCRSLQNSGGPWIPWGSMGWSGQDPNSKDWDLDNWPSGKKPGPRGYMRLDARMPLLPWINQMVVGKSRNGKKN